MNQLVGLVACGGRSSRMGSDKSLVNYHGIPQAEYVYKMLQPFCDSVALSFNQQQPAITGYNLIRDEDQFADIGPMAGLLSAFSKYPSAALLVVGCDYPFLKPGDISLLLQNRDEDHSAISYFNQAENLYEPLLCIYENEMKERLVNEFSRQQYSLQAILKEANACKVYPTNLNAIRSIDSYSAYLEAFKEIKSK